MASLFSSADFQVGETYLVYANNDEASNESFTGSRTQNRTPPISSFYGSSGESVGNLSTLDGSLSGRPVGLIVPTIHGQFAAERSKRPFDGCFGVVLRGETRGRQGNK